MIQIINKKMSKEDLLG